MGSHGDEYTCEECREIAENVLLSSGDWERLEGWAINTQEMNPEEYEEIFWEGKKLEEAISDYVRKTFWWSYKPSDGEQVFEEFWDAVKYHEESKE